MSTVSSRGRRLAIAGSATGIDLRGIKRNVKGRTLQRCPAFCFSAREDHIDKSRLSVALSWRHSAYPVYIHCCTDVRVPHQLFHDAYRCTNLIEPAAVRMAEGVPSQRSGKSRCDSSGVQVLLTDRVLMVGPTGYRAWEYPVSRRSWARLTVSNERLCESGRDRNEIFGAFSLRFCDTSGAGSTLDRECLQREIEIIPLQRNYLRRT